MENGKEEGEHVSENTVECINCCQFLRSVKVGS